MNKKNILIIGASGLIGNSLFIYLKKKKINVFGTYRINKKKNYIKLDTRNSKINKKNFEKFTHIIICQNSFKKLDEYEKNWKLGHKADYIDLSKFLLNLKNYNIKPIYISSDAVFDGLNGNYKETEIPNPLNKYGYIKKKMEFFIKKNFSKFVIIRISKYFSSRLTSGDFLKDMIYKIKYKKNAKYAGDEQFSPIYEKDLNKYIYNILAKDLNGFYHLSSLKKISRYNLAIKIKSIVKSKCKILKSKINSIKFNAKRGKNCTLNTDKYDKLFSNKKKKLEYYLKIFL